MSKKERKLTENEIKRKEVFEANKQKLESEGYTSTHLTMGVVKANVLALVVMLPFIVLFVLLYNVVNPEVNSDIGGYGGFLFLVILLVLVVVHEGIHGLTWGIFAENHFKSISFGIIWSMLTPYCACKDGLNKWQYLLGAAMPTIILGFGLALVSVFLNNPFLLFLSLLMIVSGGGDFLVILMIMFHKSKGKETLYIDHPYELGVVVFER